MDPLNGFSGGLGTNYFPLAGINNQGLTAGLSDDTAFLLQIGDVEASAFDPVDSGSLNSIAHGLNNTGVIVGEDTMRGFAFDIATGETLNINDFQRTGFQVDTILSLEDINDEGVFTGIARRGSLEFGFSGRTVIAVPEPGLFGLVSLPFRAGKQVVVWLFSSKEEKKEVLEK